MDIYLLYVFSVSFTESSVSEKPAVQSVKLGRTPATMLKGSGPTLPVAGTLLKTPPGNI